MSLEKVTKALLAQFLAAYPCLAEGDPWMGKIQFPNVTFTPPQAQMWLAWYFMPAGDNVQTMGPVGLQEYTGLVHVNINIPEGTGEMTSRAEIDNLRACYCPRVVSYDGQSVTILASSPNTGATANGYYTIPFTVRWRASVQRSQ